MDANFKLLQAIVENGRMGEDACAQLLLRAKDAPLRQELMLEKQYYAQAVRQAEKQLSDMGNDPHPKGLPARMGLWMGMQINTLLDQSSAHIADILIQGATMGIIELTKARNSFSDASAQAQGIAAELIAKQQAAIDRLKAFLQMKAVVK